MSPHPSNKAKREKNTGTKNSSQWDVSSGSDSRCKLRSGNGGGGEGSNSGGNTGIPGPVKQPAIGTARSKGSAHALGYEHPEIGVGASVVSPPLYHPSILRSWPYTSVSEEYKWNQRECTLAATAEDAVRSTCY